MSKKLKDIIGEVAQPDSPDEKEFKDKHIVKDTPYPAKGTDDVLNARKGEKGKAKKTKITHISKEEEEQVYEEVSQDDLMALVDEILEEDYDILEQLIDEGILEDIKTIAEGEDEHFIELKDGTEVEVDPQTASAISDVVEFLNDTNRDKFIERLEESEESFMRMVDFAISMRGE
jgi:NADH dehydrogenase/NADH:ubiquinone oxidoreductase subunit G